VSTIIRCASCDATANDRSPDSVCSRCGGLLLVEHSPKARNAELREIFDERARRIGVHTTAMDRSGVWRYRELVLGATDAEVVSHPEGNTPLLSRDAVNAHAGMDHLLLKHEGHNPTASFKDRGMTVALTQARRIGARAVACASTGNTSASLSAYAAQAGIPAFVFVPEGQVSGGKLAQTLAYGAHMLRIKGDFDECLRLARDASAQLGVYLVNSINPFRIEGQKTIMLELFQQLGWDAPDWITLPAGNLGNTSAFGKAIDEAYELGLIVRKPRLLAVQAAGAAPFAQGFAEHFARRVRVEAETRATAIRIGDPASWDRAVRAIEKTDGLVVSVTDDEIFASKRVIDRSGIGCEPASAASVAGLKKLVASGTISRDARVVSILTGHLLKDPGPQDDGVMKDALTRDEALRTLESVVKKG
jgi:threonine synthase